MTEYPCAEILVQGSKITAIGPDLFKPQEADVRVIDVSCKLVMPGLI